ncbi:oligosaccharide flippase family protein [Candidatus Peregrinibacteria bacterium]|nr:oligosaccharide flippase family protein [Candidatus Peregrinibacteria bacterium]
MSSRAVAASTLWQFASQITMAALSIVAVKFVAIGLTKELAGIYNSSYGYLQLFGILADFGLYAVAVREVAKAKDKERTLGALIVLRAVILFLSLGSAIVFVWVLPQWRGTPLPMGVLLASLVPALTLLAGIIRTVFQVRYALQYVFVAEVTQRIISTGIIVAIVLMGTRESADVSVLYAMLLAGGAGAVILLAISLIAGNRLMRIRPVFDRLLIGDLLKKAAPFGVAYLFLALYRQFDLTLIALLRPDFDLQNAYYGFVVRMSDMGFVLPTFLLNSTLPILSERDEKGEDTSSLLGKTFLIILIIGAVSGLFAALWPEALVRLMTTNAYLSTPTQAGSDTALLLIALPMFLNGIILYCFYVLLTRHVWRRLTLTLGLGAVVALVCNVMLIPQHGFVGATITSIIVHCVLTILLLPQAFREMPMRFPRAFAMQFLLFTGSLAATLWLFRPFLNTDIATVLGLGAMSVLMIGLGKAIGLEKTVL